MTAEEGVEVWAAAELLEMTIPAVYDLVFTRRLLSVAAPNGRRLVPLSAITDFRASNDARPQ